MYGVDEEIDIKQAIEFIKQQNHGQMYLVKRGLINEKKRF